MRFLIDECLHTSLVTVAHHAGLVIIIPNVVPLRQRDLFRAALTHIGGRSMVNTVLEIDVVGASAICREYPYPFP